MGEPTRVLLVDDERLMRMTLRLQLTREGYRVDEAASLGEACERLTQADYDLVLTDLRLGDGSGVEVVRFARRENPRAAVLLLTGSCDDISEAEALEAGATSVLVKPCRLSDLSQAARMAVKHHGPEPGI